MLCISGKDLRTDIIGAFSSQPALNLKVTLFLLPVEPIGEPSGTFSQLKNLQPPDGFNPYKNKADAVILSLSATVQNYKTIRQQSN